MHELRRTEVNHCETCVRVLEKDQVDVVFSSGWVGGGGGEAVPHFSSFFFFSTAAFRAALAAACASSMDCSLRRAMASLSPSIASLPHRPGDFCDQDKAQFMRCTVCTGLMYLIDAQTRVLHGSMGRGSGCAGIFCNMHASSRMITGGREVKKALCGTYSPGCTHLDQIELHTTVVY